MKAKPRHDDWAFYQPAATHSFFLHIRLNGSDRASLADITRSERKSASDIIREMIRTKAKTVRGRR
jgi:hypothetical protein